jgi:hypothetical protein
MNKTKIPSINKKQIQKMKKNANDPVDIHVEKQMDPKYKTEMCKSWIQTNFCVYGNKCRFAHGTHEIFSKSLITNKYKQKDCKSFVENGFCIYGMRCNFRHSELKLKEMDRSYYSYMMNCYSEDKLKKIAEEDSCHGSNWQFFAHSGNNYYNLHNNCHNNNFLKVKNQKRLSVFLNISRKSSSSLSDNSTENNSENECDIETEALSNTNSNSKLNHYYDAFVYANANEILDSSVSSSNCDVYDQYSFNFNSISYGNSYGNCNVNAISGLGSNWVNYCNEYNRPLNM